MYLNVKIPMYVYSHWALELLQCTHVFCIHVRTSIALATIVYYTVHVHTYILTSTYCIYLSCCSCTVLCSSMLVCPLDPQHGYVESSAGRASSLIRLYNAYNVLYVHA